MTWVKICGITNLEDALTAVDAGADALGFVFYEKSPRRVAADTVREIVATLPAAIEKVGVFVYDPGESPASIAESCGLTAVQIHLRLPLSVPAAPNTPLRAVASGKPARVYLALPVSWFHGDRSVKTIAASFAGPGPFPGLEAILLDSGNAEQPGGTGKPFDWQQMSSVVDEMRTNRKVVVAGGLTPNNVGEAIRILKPWGVDVSSGVEARPGRKDPERVRAFIKAVRDLESRN